jgi:Mg-chelatase subunit ChlD
VTAAADPAEIVEPPPHVSRSLIPSFYGLELRAKDLVFVLDISGSIGSAGVARAKRELAEAIELLPSDVRIAALFFAEEVRLWKPEMVRATPAAKADLALFVRGIDAGRKTDVFTPLNAGLQIVRRRLEEKDAAGEPVREAVTLVVVSDGVETAHQTPAAVVADKLDRLDAARTAVHAVAIGGKPSPLLFELARRGGGHYVEAR